MNLNLYIVESIKLLFKRTQLDLNINITIQILLKFDLNSDANANIEVQCERDLKTQFFISKFFISNFFISKFFISKCFYQQNFLSAKFFISKTFEHIDIHGAQLVGQSTLVALFALLDVAPGFPVVDGVTMETGC